MTPRPPTALKRFPLFDAGLVVLEAAVDIPFPDVKVETVSDAEMLAEDDIDSSLVGIEVANERGGGGVTAEMVTSVLDEVREADVSVGMSLLAKRRVENNGEENVPVARELLIRF